MRNTLLRLAVSTAVFAPPVVVSAATLTATQQGVVSTSAPIGAQRAVFLDLALTAGCDAPVTVSSFDVRHRGLGSVTDLARVYATEGDVRMTHTRSLNSSGSPTTIQFYPAIVVPACSTRTLQIRGDFSSDASAGGEHGLLVDAVEAGDAEVRLSAGRAAVVTATPANVGSVNVVLLGLSRTPRYGQSATLARLRLEADGYKDQYARSIVLTNKGKASGKDLQNLYIRNARGEALTATIDSMDRRFVRLKFTEPLLLSKNTEMLLELVGDVRASKSRTISFVLEEPSDLEVTATSSNRSR